AQVRNARGERPVVRERLPDARCVSFLRRDLVLRVDRGPLTGSAVLDADVTFSDHIPKNPEQSTAIRLVAEYLAHVVARECVRQAVERRVDLVACLVSFLAVRLALGGWPLLRSRSGCSRRRERGESHRRSDAGLL